MKRMLINGTLELEEISAHLPTKFEFLLLDALRKDLGFAEKQDATVSSYFMSCASVDSHGLIRSRDHKNISSFSKRYGPSNIIRDLGLREKSDALAFFSHYQLSSFLKKYPVKGIDSRLVAIEKFHFCEISCDLFNKENYQALLAMDAKHPDFLGCIAEMQSDILRLLGEIPNINSVYYHAKHGPGSAVGDLYKDGKVTPFFKWYNLPYTVTLSAKPLAIATIQNDPRWIGALDDWYRSKNNIPLGGPIDLTHFWETVIQVVPGSRITTVPKSIDTDRTIAIEPVLNMFLQLGVGGDITAKLKRRWGIDLHDQEKNQRLATEGSISDLLSTIDLAGASDTVSMKIVEILLPGSWFDLLYDLRSAVGLLDDREITFAKISAMGNGYTFALESLIFAAIARCAVSRTRSKGEFAVYGDDIIVPKTATDFLIQLLNLCGFSLNKEKSFIEGPFRESCGEDRFLGTYVRPVILTREIKTVADLFYIHNAFWRLKERLPWFFGLTFSNVMELIKKYIPKEIRETFSGSPSESLDTHLFSHDRLPRTSGGFRLEWRLTATALTFNHLCDAYFFRKLMVTLKEKPPVHRWDKARSLSTGNAFDITIRDRVLYKSTLVRVW